MGLLSLVVWKQTASPRENEKYIGNEDDQTPNHKVTKRSSEQVYSIQADLVHVAFEVVVYLFTSSKASVGI